MKVGLRIRFTAPLTLLLLVAAPMLSAAQDNTEQSAAFTALGFEFVVNDDSQTCSLIGAAELTEGELVIPEQVQSEGKTYTVSFIGYHAFFNNHKLRSVTIPGSVKSIGIEAFAGCDYLNNEVIHEGCTDVCLFAFSRCSALKSVRLPLSLNYIDSGAFAGCSQLQNIDLPDNDCLFVHHTAFAGCDKLRGTIKYPVPQFFHTKLFDCIVGDDGKTCSVRKGIFTDLDSVLIVPQSLTDQRGRDYAVTAISDGGFYFCHNLKTVSLPATIEMLGGGAFYFCDKLADISLPEGVTVIDEAAFLGCHKLNSVKLPATLKTIGPRAFAECAALTEIDIPEGVTLVDTAAFSECANLAKILLPSTLTNINLGAFAVTIRYRPYLI